MPQEFPTTLDVKSQAAQYSRDVMLFDDFEGRFRWTKSGTGGDDVLDEFNNASFAGEKGMRIQTRATNPAEDDYTTAEADCCLTEASNCYARARVHFVSPTTGKDCYIVVDWSDGTRNYKAGLKLDDDASKIYYWNSSGAWEEITGVTYDVNDDAFQWMQVALDLANKKYLGVKCGQEAESLASIDVQNVGAETERYMHIQITITADGAAQASLYVDCVYVGATEDP
jgi:hypothetical protein